MFNFRIIFCWVWRDEWINLTLGHHTLNPVKFVAFYSKSLNPFSFLAPKIKIKQKKSRTNDREKRMLKNVLLLGTAFLLMYTAFQVTTLFYTSKRGEEIEMQKLALVLHAFLN